MRSALGFVRGLPRILELPDVWVGKLSHDDARIETFLRLLSVVRFEVEAGARSTHAVKVLREREVEFALARVLASTFTHERYCNVIH